MRTILVFFAAIIVIAGGAALGTRALIEHREEDHSDDTMHRWLHDKLDLTPEQVRSLEQLEVKFADDEKRLRTKLDEANRALAKAMVEDKAYTPRVTLAVEQVHHWMGELQKLSIAHLFDMRSHLTPEQNEKLLHYAEMALTDAP
jgi:hypothetical protein